MYKIALTTHILLLKFAHIKYFLYLCSGFWNLLIRLSKFTNNIE